VTKIGAKTYEESIKYEVRFSVLVEGIVSESDIVGAMFGQTEGLLDEDMELKHLQKSGRIGRIVLELKTKGKITRGIITIPSSLAKVETAILSATVETVDRVGACDATIKLENIKDVRKEKLNSIADRASEIMKKWGTGQETEELTKQVIKSSRVLKPTVYGPDKLTAGPDVFDSDEIILVEGRADVIKLLKINITNAVEMRGTKVSRSIITLCKNKTVIALLDGDRGGDTILKDLAVSASVDFVARAPLRKEVENLSRKQLEEALENKVELLDAVFMTEDMSISEFYESINYKPRIRGGKQRDSRKEKPQKKSRFSKSDQKIEVKTKSRYTGKSDKAISEPRLTENGKLKGGKKKISDENKRESYEERPRRSKMKDLIPEDLKTHITTIKHSAKSLFLDEAGETISTVATSEAFEFLVDNTNISSIIIDGVITQRLINEAQNKDVKYLIGAVVGDFDRRKVSQSLTFATFNRIN